MHFSFLNTELGNSHFSPHIIFSSVAKSNGEDEDAAADLQVVAAVYKSILEAEDRVVEDPAVVVIQMEAAEVGPLVEVQTEEGAGIGLDAAEVEEGVDSREPIGRSVVPIGHLAHLPIDRERLQIDRAAPPPNYFESAFAEVLVVESGAKQEEPEGLQPQVSRPSVMVCCLQLSSADFLPCWARWNSLHHAGFS